VVRCIPTEQSICGNLKGDGVDVHHVIVEDNVNLNIPDPVRENSVNKSERVCACVWERERGRGRETREVCSAQRKRWNTRVERAKTKQGVRTDNLVVQAGLALLQPLLHLVQSCT
jgi:hypothetical protein